MVVTVNWDAQVHERSPRSLMKMARSVVPGRDRGGQRRLRRCDLRIHDLPRLFDDRVGERDLALTPDERHAVLGHVEQRRGDPAFVDPPPRRCRARPLARPRWRAAEPAFGRAANSSPTAGRRRSMKPRAPGQSTACHGRALRRGSRAAAVAEADHASTMRLHDVVLELALTSCFSCSGLVMKPISISTAGMFAPTSTRKAAGLHQRARAHRHPARAAPPRLAREAWPTGRCGGPAPSPGHDLDVARAAAEDRQRRSRARSRPAASPSSPSSGRRPRRPLAAGARRRWRAG
jgi:hypothetical protein